MTSDERAGGTFVYHPLLPGSDLHELWRASRSGIAAPPAPPSEPLARQYQAHLRARLRTTPGGDAVAVPAHLEEDDRPLVHRFRTFLPVLLDHCGAPPEVAGNEDSGGLVHDLEAVPTESDARQSPKSPR